MGASGPLFHDFVWAITPFICICSPFISEKPPPRGCRHCWPNHVKYCVCYNAFSLSNLRLIGLSHPIGLPSCPNSLLKRFRTYPFATRAFFDVTIGAVCGNRYSEFRFEWGLPLDRASHDLSNPRKITIIGDCTRRHAPVKYPARSSTRHHAQPSQRSQKPAPSGIESSS
jgi:hypothetical protein